MFQGALLLLLIFVFESRSFRTSRLVRRQAVNLYAVPKKRPPVLPDLSQKSFPPVPEHPYDLLVIGSGPGGEACAVRASQLGAHVAIIEKRSTFGGPTGLTSKAVREAAKRICKAVDQIGGDRRRQVRGLWKRSFPVLKSEAEVLQAAETRDRLARNGVDLFVGVSKFVNTRDGTGDGSLFFYDPMEAAAAEANRNFTTVRVCRQSECINIVAKHVCIATGSRPNKPAEASPGVSLPFVKGRVVCATEMGNLPSVPSAAAVIGGGVIAVEYATVLAELGVGVSLICPEKAFLPFLDQELRETLKRRMKRGHILFVHEPIKEIIVEEAATTTKKESDGSSSVGAPIRVVLESRHMQSSVSKVERQLPERRLTVDLVLYSGGRDANSEDLGLSNVHVDVGKYGRIVVDEHHATTASREGLSIFAVGDVIGPPGLASAAQQQARAMADRLFGHFENADMQGQGQEDKSEEEEEEQMNFDENEKDDFFSSGSKKDDDDEDEATTLFGSSEGGEATDAPITLWTIPEIASVGMTYEAACAKAPSIHARQSVIQGYAYFKDMARGRLSGDLDGFLKIIAWKSPHAKHHTIVGVHIMGEGANELIQMGSILIHGGATLEQVSRTPFAAVTLSGLYQMACDDALVQERKEKKLKRKEEASVAEQPKSRESE